MAFLAKGLLASSVLFKFGTNWGMFQLAMEQWNNLSFHSLWNNFKSTSCILTVFAQEKKKRKEKTHNYNTLNTLTWATLIPPVLLVLYLDVILHFYKQNLSIIIWGITDVLSQFSRAFLSCQYLSVNLSLPDVITQVCQSVFWIVSNPISSTLL